MHFLTAPRALLPLFLLTALPTPVRGQARLYWTATDGTGAYIMQAEADGSNPAAILTGSAAVRGPNGLESAAGVLYWPDQQLGEIRKVNPDGSGAAATTRADNPYDVFVTAEQVYWTSQTGNYIDTQRLDGTGYRRLLASPDVASPFAIEVTATHIYWSQVNGSGSLRRSDLNGGNIVTVINRAYVYDFQVTSNYIYFADNNFPSAIKRANLDGSNVTPLVADGGFYNGVCVTADALYWSAFMDANGSGVRRAGLDGSNPVNLHNAPGGTSVRGVVVLSQGSSVQGPRFSHPATGPAGFTASLAVEAGRAYGVEASSDATRWSEVTNFTSTGTTYTFTYPLPAGTNSLLFRAVTR